MSLHRLLTTAALGLAAFTALAAPDPTGWWAVRMGQQDNPCEIYFHITRSEAGLKGTWGAPMFGDSYLNQPLPEPKLEGNTLTIGPFVAEYDEKTDTFSGPFSMFGPSAPAVWHRASGVPAPELELSAPDFSPAVWTFATGGEVWATPVVDAGTLYIGSDDGHLYALSAQDGKLRWKYATGGAIRSRAALTATQVLIASDDGFVHAVNREDGTRAWVGDMHGGAIKRDMENQLDYPQSSPAVEGQTVYCGSADGSVYAFDLKSGAEKWHHATGALVRSTPAFTKGLVVVGNWAGKVVAMDATTGAERWVFDGKMSITSDVAVADGHLLVGSRYSYLWALDPETGKEKWFYNYWWSWVDSTATIENDRAYIGSSDGRNVWALGVATGKPLWRFRTDGYAWSQPVIDGDRVYVSTIAATNSVTKHGSVYVLNKADGKMLRKLRASGNETKARYKGAFSSVAFDTANLYFASTDGLIYAYRK